MFFFSPLKKNVLKLKDSYFAFTKKMRDSHLKYVANKSIVTVSFIYEILRLADRKALRGLLHVNCVKNHRVRCIFSCEM